MQRKWVERTIRSGKVRVYGKTYVPDQRHIRYDGRLDGLRYLFCRYPEIVGYPLLGLDSQVRRPIGEHGPELVDGVFPWFFWHKEA